MLAQFFLFSPEYWLQLIGPGYLLSGVFVVAAVAAITYVLRRGQQD